MKCRRSGKLEKFYRGEGGYYFVRYCPTDYHVDFKVWELITFSAPVMFGEFGENMSEKPDDHKPFIDGAVKWDGCSNFDFPELKECMLHGCSRQDLTDIGILLGRIWDQCVALCPNAAEVEAEAHEIIEDAGFPWEESDAKAVAS